MVLTSPIVEQENLAPLGMSGFPANADDTNSSCHSLNAVVADDSPTGILKQKNDGELPSSESACNVNSSVDHSKSALRLERKGSGKLQSDTETSVSCNVKDSSLENNGPNGKDENTECSNQAFQPQREVVVQKNEAEPSSSSTDSPVASTTSEKKENVVEKVTSSNVSSSQFREESSFKPKVKKKKKLSNKKNIFTKNVVLRKKLVRLWQPKGCSFSNDYKELYNGHLKWFEKLQKPTCVGRYDRFVEIVKVESLTAIVFNKMKISDFEGASLSTIYENLPPDHQIGDEKELLGKLLQSPMYCWAQRQGFYRKNFIQDLVAEGHHWQGMLYLRKVWAKISTTDEDRIKCLGIFFSDSVKLSELSISNVICQKMHIGFCYAIYDMVTSLLKNMHHMKSTGGVSSHPGKDAGVVWNIDVEEKESNEKVNLPKEPHTFSHESIVSLVESKAESVSSSSTDEVVLPEVIQSSNTGGNSLKSTKNSLIYVTTAPSEVNSSLDTSCITSSQDIHNVMSSPQDHSSHNIPSDISSQGISTNNSLSQGIPAVLSTSSQDKSTPTPTQNLTIEHFGDIEVSLQEEKEEEKFSDSNSPVKHKENDGILSENIPSDRHKENEEVKINDSNQPVELEEKEESNLGHNNPLAEPEKERELDNNISSLEHKEKEGGKLGDNSNPLAELEEKGGGEHGDISSVKHKEKEEERLSEINSPLELEKEGGELSGDDSHVKHKGKEEGRLSENNPPIKVEEKEEKLCDSPLDKHKEDKGGTLDNNISVTYQEQEEGKCSNIPKVKHKETEKRKLGIESCDAPVKLKVMKVEEVVSSPEKVKKRMRKEHVITSQKKAQCFLPLRKGWVRECVHRGVTSTIRLDIYYHPPQGRKLRSSVEVQKYLAENKIKDLVVDNFSFNHRAFGYGPPYELERSAKVSPGCFKKKAEEGSEAQASNTSPSKPKKRKKKSSHLDDSFIYDNMLDDTSITNEIGETTGYEDWFVNKFKSENSVFIKDENLYHEGYNAAGIQIEKPNNELVAVSSIPVQPESSNVPEQSSPNLKIVEAYSLKDSVNKAKKYNNSAGKSSQKNSVQNFKSQKHVGKRKNTHSPDRNWIKTSLKMFAPDYVLPHLKSHLQDIGVSKSGLHSNAQNPTFKTYSKGTKKDDLKKMTIKENSEKIDHAKNSWLHLVKLYEKRRHKYQLCKATSTTEMPSTSSEGLAMRVAQDLSTQRVAQDSSAQKTAQDSSTSTKRQQNPIRVRSLSELCSSSGDTQKDIVRDCQNMPNEVAGGTSTSSSVSQSVATTSKTVSFSSSNLLPLLSDTQNGSLLQSAVPNILETGSSCNHARNPGFDSSQNLTPQATNIVESGVQPTQKIHYIAIPITSAPDVAFNPPSQTVSQPVTELSQLGASNSHSGNVNYQMQVVQPSLTPNVPNISIPSTTGSQTNIPQLPQAPYSYVLVKYPALTSTVNSQTSNLNPVISQQPVTSQVNDTGTALQTNVNINQSSNVKLGFYKER